jgi:hypothetical protein
VLFENDSHSHTAPDENDSHYQVIHLHYCSTSAAMLRSAAFATDRPANHRPGRHALSNQAGWVNWLLATGTAFYKVLLQFPELRPKDRHNSAVNARGRMRPR